MGESYNHRAIELGLLVNDSDSPKGNQQNNKPPSCSFPLYTVGLSVGRSRKGRERHSSQSTSSDQPQDLLSLMYAPVESEVGIASPIHITLHPRQQDGRKGRKIGQAHLPTAVTKVS